MGPDAAREDPVPLGDGCSSPSIEPGHDVSFELMHDGTLRRYRVHVPVGLERGAPVPLVFAYHDNVNGSGAATTPEDLAVQSGLDEKADAEKFIVVYPQAVGLFNAGDFLGRFGDPPQAVDDAAFTRVVLEDVADKACVDARRVYSVGLGVGGTMSAWNACENADLFAAVASVAGMGFGMHVLGCSPGRPVPLIALNAENDGTQASNYTLARWEMDRWVEQAECSAAPQRESVGGDSCDHWKDCAGDVELTHCTADASDHCWFGSPHCAAPASDLVATDRIWEFFARFRLPIGDLGTVRTDASDGGPGRAVDAIDEPTERLDPAAEPEGCRAPSLGPGAELTVELSHGGMPRSYLLHVPAGLDPSVPAPFVFDYHGATSTPELEAADSQMSAKADTEGFVVVYPRGIGATFNAGSCCSLFGTTPHLEDDAGFTRAILADVASKLCVDLRRVYATGASNGGWMSEWNACKNGDIFAAVAPVVGMGAAQPDCMPSRPMPMIAFNFVDDPYVSYATSTWEWGVWVDERNQCAGEPERETFGQGFCDHWTSCAGGVEMVRCTLDGADHCWPGGGAFCPGAAPASFARDRAWEFMSRFTLPLE